jgi:hypothetical protein
MCTKLTRVSPIILQPAHWRKVVTVAVATDIAIDDTTMK